MALRFNHTLVVGNNGYDAAAENNLRLLRSVTLKTDRSEYVYNSVPVGLSTAGISCSGVRRDSRTASRRPPAIFHPHQPLFVDPLAIKPEDTVLNTARYSAVTLELDSAPSPTCSAPGHGHHRVNGVVTSSAARAATRQVRPLIFTEYGVRVPVDPSVVQVIDMERASNLATKRWQYFACNTTTVPGVPFSGIASDAILTDVDVDHDGGRPFETDSPSGAERHQ